MDGVELQNRFAYHQPSVHRAGQHQDVRENALEFALFLLGALPDCRELALAITSLEETMFWANAALARYPDVE